MANFNGKIIPTFQLFRCNAVSFDDNLIFSQLSHNNLIADSHQAINSTLYAFQTCSETYSIKTTLLRNNKS
jgi:hypothetical protein